MSTFEERPVRVRRLWRTLVAAGTGDDRRSDVLTATTTFVLGSLTLLVGLVGLFRPALTVPVWWHLALLVLGCLLIVGKREHPLRALLGGVAVVGVDLWWGGSLALLLVLWDLLYSAMLWTGPVARRWLWGTAGAVVASGTVAAALSSGDPRQLVSMSLQLGAIVLMPLWWATNVRQKSELAELERQRADLVAERAERERHEAVRAERAAMARDLHDVVAAHVSAAALHSGAALAAPADTGRDRRALEQVRSSAVTALDEMRTMILLLRGTHPGSGAPDTVAAPARLTGEAGLDSLLGVVRATGSRVVVDDQDGVMSSTLPAAVDHALHRIAQEALTNAAKHASGQPVTVWLRRAGQLVELRVDSDGAVVGPPAVRDGSLSGGTGLLTMRERAEGLRGTLTAGPRPGGGWSVSARLPTSAPGVGGEAR